MPDPAASTPQPGDAAPAAARGDRVERSRAGPFEFEADWEYEVHGRRRHYVVEARLDGAFAGRAYGWFEPGRQLVLQKIEVEEAVRSRGCGSAIIALLRGRARRARCTELVIAGVRPSNRGAIRLYESLGARCIQDGGALRSFVLTP